MPGVPLQGCVSRQGPVCCRPVVTATQVPLQPTKAPAKTKSKPKKGKGKAVNFTSDDLGPLMAAMLKLKMGSDTSSDDEVDVLANLQASMAKKVEELTKVE